MVRSLAIWVARRTRSSDSMPSTVYGSRCCCRSSVHCWTAQAVCRILSTAPRNSTRTRGEQSPEITNCSSFCSSSVVAFSRSETDGALPGFSPADSMMKVTLLKCSQCPDYAAAGRASCNWDGNHTHHRPSRHKTSARCDFGKGPCFSVYYEKHAGPEKHRGHRQRHEHHLHGDVPAHHGRKLSRRQRSAQGSEVRSPLPRRSRAAARRKRPGKMRSLLPLRRQLSLELHLHRSRRQHRRTPRKRRRTLRQNLQHRLQQVYLLWVLRGGLPYGRYYAWAWV